MEIFTVPNLLSWSASIMLLIGLKLIGDKKLSGFYIASVAEVIWIIWGLMTGSFALVFMSMVIMVMYARAIWLWNKSSELPLSQE